MDPILINEYKYELPDERIAKYPLEQRDFSKLLVFDEQKSISHTVFSSLPELLSCGQMIVFNNTKVVPARMHFRKPTGAVIEIFALEPHSPKEYNLIFEERQKCEWKCIVGNAKKWKEGSLELINPENSAEIAALGMKATLVEKDQNSAIVAFEWSTGAPFSEVLETVGSIPIPPYLNRATEAIDLTRYQTTYAMFRGSVAAPTAGLHFSERELTALKEKGVKIQNVCLHVGAGTFLPVKSENVQDHKMHSETVCLKKSFIDALVEHLEEPEKKTLTAVGTTSVRTLESLYYIGRQILENGAFSEVSQWCPYDGQNTASTLDAIKAIQSYMTSHKKEEISFPTQIIIVPGFRFRIVDRLITNFHQPGSTLLLLIAAFVGDDWKRIYDYALKNDFRFLSYGDSSILTRQTNL